MKCVCNNYFVVIIFMELINIKKISSGQFYITEEERRAAETLHSDAMHSESNKRHLFSKPSHQSPPSIGLGPGYHERERPLYEHNYNPPDFHHSFEKENPYPTTDSKGGHLQSYPGEYSETYAHGGYEYPVGGHGHGSTAVGYNVGNMMDFQKLKSLLLPLAGLALLGAAAVFTTNPVMLPLGVISGRRRRRNLLEDDKPFIYPADHVVKAYRNFSKIN